MISLSLEPKEKVFLKKRKFIRILTLKWQEKVAQADR